MSLTWRSSYGSRNQSSGVCGRLAEFFVVEHRDALIREWWSRKILGRACAAGHSRGCWRATIFRPKRWRRVRRPTKAPFPTEYVGASPATVCRNTRPTADTPRSDCTQAGSPARSSPPGRYRLRPILRVNFLNTNRIVSCVDQNLFQFVVTLEFAPIKSRSTHLLYNQRGSLHVTI